MTWYAAHIVMLVKFKLGQQRRFPAWENIVLVQAANEDAALTKAEAIGLAGNGDDDGSFTWGGKPAMWEFAGVRKLTECALMGDRPASGDEITFSELEFESLAAAKRFAAGRLATVRHQDQIRVLAEADLRKLPSHGVSGPKGLLRHDLETDYLSHCICAARCLASSARKMYCRSRVASNAF